MVATLAEKKMPSTYNNGPEIIESTKRRTLSRQEVHAEGLMLLHSLCLTTSAPRTSSSSSFSSVSSVSPTYLLLSCFHSATLVRKSPSLLSIHSMFPFVAHFLFCNMITMITITLILSFYSLLQSLRVILSVILSCVLVTSHPVNL